MSESKEGIRLLLVDDELEFLHALEPGLSRRGFEVTMAESGSTALELLSNRVFDVIVLDVKMPGINGVDTFREIKRSAPDLPVILLTGHGNVEQAFETSREGVFEYLTKPCEVERLARVARQAAEAATVKSAEDAEATEDIRLLLVDDERDFVKSLTQALERRGVIVSKAYDGYQALEKIGFMEFHVAVVDVFMPSMDGLALLDRLREIDPLLEVIILSGRPSVDDVRRGLREGAFDYLTKPQRVEDLYHHIHAAWERRERRREEELRRETERIFEERPD